MRLLLLLAVVAACDKHDESDPLASLGKTHDQIWCEHAGDDYFCRPTECSGSDCVVVKHPHWACAKTVDKKTHELQTDNCWPTLEMCEAPKNSDADLIREDCRQVPKVYCHAMNGIELCHPVPALCGLMAKMFADKGVTNTVEPCIER